MPEFIESWHKNEGVDVMLGRWIADYDDPDNFTFTLFHSGNGAARAYFSSPETDRVLEEARAEARPAAREALYRKFEHALLDPAHPRSALPRLDYRIAGRAYAGFSSAAPPPTSTMPTSGKPSEQRIDACRRPDGRGDPPRAHTRASSGPSIHARWDTRAQARCRRASSTRSRARSRARGSCPGSPPEVIERKTGDGTPVPAAPGVRFHDGRRLTARDVRSSWERLLLTPSVGRWLLSPIRGARRLIDGEATDLEGFHIVSPSEFCIDLEKPVAFFPGRHLLDAPTAILPEGTGTVGANRRRRVRRDRSLPDRRIRPRPRLELERNPTYSARLSALDGIVFRFGASPEAGPRGFLGREALARLRPAPGDAEAFRHDPRFASRYNENPRSHDLLRALQPRRGLSATSELRRVLARAVDVGGSPRAIGRLAIPAHGIIPPASSATRRRAGSGSRFGASGRRTARSGRRCSRETIEPTAASPRLLRRVLGLTSGSSPRPSRRFGFVSKADQRGTMDEYGELQNTGEGELNIGALERRLSRRRQLRAHPAAFGLGLPRPTSAMPSSINWPNGGGPKRIRA